MDDTAINSNVTQLLIRYGKGEKDALNTLMPLVYQELRKLAHSYMRKEGKEITLQPTALLHEAFFRLVDQKEAHWQNRAHFYGVAAQLMRRILIDAARARHAGKRGGKDAKIEFDEAVHFQTTEDDGPDLVALDSALQRLSALDERQGKVVELRYFGGLSIEETAEVLETSPATVKRDWTLAKAWLHRELSSENNS